MTGLDLVAIGEGMVEFHAEGGSFDGTQVYRRGFAGDVVNCLINASRLGLRTALVSRIGDDAFAPALVRAWTEEGIDLSRAPVVPGENGIYFILNDDRGEREFIYRRAGSAASRMGPEDVDRAFLEQARYVLVSGITQAISATAEALIESVAALPSMKSCGFYDPNYRPRLWNSRGGVEAARRAFRAVAPQVAWLLPSYPADLPLAEAAPTQDAGACARSLASEFGVRVALKLGVDGVLLQSGDEATHVPVVKVNRVIDSTGAGDAWNAAFIAGLARGVEPAAAAAAANAHAASTLGHGGAIPPRYK